jgi:hypothetical protein
MSYYYTRVFRHYHPKLLEITGALRELRHSFKKTNLLLCGESHGVRENADIVYTLTKALGVEELAIERCASSFAAFVQSAVAGEPNFLLPYVLPSLQASVLSLEMLKTIVVLLKEGAIKHVAYVDLDSLNNPALKNIDAENYMRVREDEIAKNIINLSTGFPTMVILGNYHTRYHSDKKTGKSALQKVRQKRNATYLRYEYLSGNQYNAGRLLNFEYKLTGSKNYQQAGYRVLKFREDDFVIEIPKAHRILV